MEVAAQGQLMQNKSLRMWTAWVSLASSIAQGSAGAKQQVYRTYVNVWRCVGAIVRKLTPQQGGSHLLM